LIALGLSAAAAQDSARPTFVHDIAPLLWAHCASCHHSGGAGPFALISYQDARRHARQIVQATRTRQMPPWLPEPGYGDFLEEQRLTDAQIALISRWVADGTPQGPASELPVPPRFPEGWVLGQPDVIVEAPRGITVPATGPDVFWNFILSPTLKTARYVRAIEIRPGATHMVHHANMIVDPARSARRREVSPGAGFPGMDLTVERPALDFDSHFLFWKPGNTPYSEPKGFSWRLDPGTDLVLNTHLKTQGRPESVRPAVGLYFTNDPPTHFPMLIQLTGDDQLDIPAGARDFVVRDDFRLPADADVLAVYPHAHYLGKLLEGFATLPDGTRKWLIRIPDWNQDWQAVYHYRKPVLLPRGSVISMRYHYDNSAANPHNPSHPPRRVQAGDQATDEMSHLWLQLLPQGHGDTRPLIEEALMRHRLAKNPTDFLASLRLGGLLMARLRAADALEPLAAAARLEPKDSEAHNLLGAALASVGRSADAIAQFRLAIQIQPDYSNARLNLANALARSGRLDEAAADYREILQVYPDDETAKRLLARTLDASGRQFLRDDKLRDALARFDEALQLDPSLQDARENRDRLKALISPQH
jgi:Tetratricopeptide repeat